MTETINNSKEYRLVLGLEIHLHLKTDTKMFCGCDANIYDAEPNTHTCPVCLGLPGALPVPNFDAVKKEQLLGLALHCELNKNSKFDRKHYFYPDLPKGYQISQYKEPLCLGGYIELESGNVAEIERIHLEEDTAKSFHEGQKTLIDFNKSGMPLVEIVTKPVFKNVEDAVDFSKKVQEYVRTLGIGDVDMEKGQMRLEANISMRTPEMEERDELPNYKVEIKNINSFRFMEKAVKAEMVRQTELLRKGEKVKQENRGFDEASGKTVPQRDKEDAHDYRYFPEPDIPPMVFKEGYIDSLKEMLPLLPHQKLKNYLGLGLKYQEAWFLSQIANEPVRLLFDSLRQKGADAIKSAALLVNKVEFRTKTADEILAALKEKESLVTDVSQLTDVVKSVVSKNEQAVADYKKGKLTSVEFLLGQVMRETKGKSDPKVVRDIIVKTLSEA